MKSLFLILSLLLLKYLLLEGRNGYLIENLNAKNILKSGKLQINIQLSAPRCNGLNCLIVVYYSRVEPRYNEPLYDDACN